MTNHSTIAKQQHSLPADQSALGTLAECSCAKQEEELPGNDSAKRRQILDGARLVFMRDGFDSASMNDITYAAGVSKSTVYAHFRSKEALFETLIREDRRVLIERLTPFNHNPKNLTETLVAIGIELVEIILHPTTVAQLRAVIAVATKFPNLGKAYYESGPVAGNARLAACFESWQAAGLLNIPDIAMAASQFSALCRSDFMLDALFGIGKPASRSEIEANVRSTVNMFLRTYHAPKAVAEEALSRFDA